jgi:hypothetical protein
MKSLQKCGSRGESHCLLLCLCNETMAVTWRLQMQRRTKLSWKIWPLKIVQLESPTKPIHMEGITGMNFWLEQSSTWVGKCGFVDCQANRHLTRFAQPHVHMYMFYPYVISTLYMFTWQITNENFQKILFSCNSSHNFTAKRNELRYHFSLSQLYFTGH